jgi:hypothetical protein
LAENGIFALFSHKIRTWTTMPLKVVFIPGFRGLLTDCSHFFGRPQTLVDGEDGRAGSFLVSTKLPVNKN